MEPTHALFCTVWSLLKSTAKSRTLCEFIEFMDIAGQSLRPRPLARSQNLARAQRASPARPAGAPCAATGSTVCSAAYASHQLGVPRFQLGLRARPRLRPCARRPTRRTNSVSLVFNWGVLGGLRVPAPPSRAFEPPNPRPTLPQACAPPPACSSPSLLTQLPPRPHPVLAPLSSTPSCPSPSWALAIDALAPPPSLRRPFASRCACKLPRTVPLCYRAPSRHFFAPAPSPPSVPAPTSRALEPSNPRPTLPQAGAPPPACSSPYILTRLPPRSHPVLAPLSSTPSCPSPSWALAIHALAPPPSLRRPFATRCARTLPRKVPLFARAPLRQFLVPAPSPPSVPALPSRALEPPNQRPTPPQACAPPPACS